MASAIVTEALKADYSKPIQAGDLLPMAVTSCRLGVYDAFITIN